MPNNNAEPELMFAAIRERDVDLLLVEELRCSDSFQRWFLEHIIDEHGLDAQSFALTSVQHSVSTSDGDGAGETDLVAEFAGPSGTVGDRLLVLIENKIDAEFQPAQAERYQKRAEEIFAEGNYGRVTTVLVAPNDYVISPDGIGFKHRVHYEEIQRFFSDEAKNNESSRETLRLNHRSEILEYAIKRLRRGWQQEVDDHTTNFAKAYYQLALKIAPSLNPAPPTPKTKGSLFIYFRNALKKQVNETEKPWYLLHKSKTKNHGRPYEKTEEVVQIVLSGWWKHQQEARERITPLLEKDMTLVQAGKSMAICLATPVIEITKDPETQEEAIKDGLKAAVRLQVWYDKNFDDLSKCARIVGA